MAWVAAAVVAWSCSGDSGGPTAPTSTSPSVPNSYGFELLKVQGGRWADSGHYLYQIGYVIQRPPVGAVYRILDVTVYGPSGEILPGYTGHELSKPFSMDSFSGLVSVTGNSAAHPFAERALVRLEVEQNGSRTIVADDHFVIHPPQTARLLELSTLPVMGGDVPPYPMVPAPVTVRWNVTSASRVILDTSLNITPSDGTLGRRLVEEVAPAGSRTFSNPRSGPHVVTLMIDGLIKKSMYLSVP